MDTKPDQSFPEKAPDEGILQPRAKVGPVPLIRTAEPAGEAILWSGGGRAELLERLSDGDPLGLYPRGVRRARERAFLLDPDRLFAQTLGCVAQAPKPGPLTRAGAPGRYLDRWIDAQIDDAIGELLDEDREALLGAGVPPRPEAYVFMTQAFGVAPTAGLTASVAFNGLQENARRAFVELFVRRRSVAECLEAGLGTAASLRLHARAALGALSGRSLGHSATSASLGGGA